MSNFRAYLGHAREQFSRTRFWTKLRAVSSRAGREIVEKALILYFTLQSPNLPPRARAVIIGALGYFILPTDAIPDFLPGVGLTDDLSAIIFALATVAAHITPEIRAKAKARADEWLG